MAENVIVKFGQYEVEPWRMQEWIKQQEMNEAARDKIRKDRMAYLTWMHNQEAYRCLPGYSEEELDGCPVL